MTITYTMILYKTLILKKYFYRFKYFEWIKTYKLYIFKLKLN